MLICRTAVPGVSVPLRQVSEIQGGWNEGQIVRRNGVRTLSVITQVKRGFNETNMQKKVEKVMNSRVIPNLPEGVSFEYGGVKESDEEIITPIIEGLSIAVIIVFLFLLINYKKIGLAVAALLLFYCACSVLLSVSGCPGWSSVSLVC